MLGTLVIIFLGGIAIDLLQTRYVACVARGDRLRAAGMSGLITFGSLVLWGTLFRRAETLGLAGAAALAFGAALGTLLGIARWRRRRAEVPELSAAGAPPLDVVDPLSSGSVSPACRSTRNVDRRANRDRSGHLRRAVRPWHRGDLAPSCPLGD